MQTHEAALRNLEGFGAHPDTELRFGTPLPPHAFHDETGGRVRARLHDISPLKIVTACAVRAAARFGVEGRSVHSATTSRSLWGDDPCAEEQGVPRRVT
jgi:hypothetical protein